MASLVAQLVKSPPATQETQIQFLGWDYPLEQGKATHSSVLKNLPEKWETWVQFLGQEGPLKKGMATHSSILDWREPSGLQSMGSQRVGT